MENNEVLFAKVLEDIKNNARLQGGYISKTDVEEALEELKLNSNQLDMVFEYLRENKIGIDEPLSMEESLSREERNLVLEYERELDNLERIDEGKKRALIMQAMNHEKSAVEELIGHYLPKVIEIARLYSGQGVYLEDLIGEGNLAVIEAIGMLDAMEEPDEADGMVVKMIMDAMEELIKENYSENSKDEKIADKVNKVAIKAKELSQGFGRKVTIEELVEEGGLSQKQVLEAIELCAKQIEDIEYNEA